MIYKKVSYKGNVWLDIKDIDVIKNTQILLSINSLKLRTSENIVILGPNGSGKSTFINLLNRSIYPVFSSNSKFSLFGKELINIWEMRNLIGFVCNDVHKRINENATVPEIILSGLINTFGNLNDLIPKDDDIYKLNKISNMLELNQYNKNQYKTLSDGIKRRVVIGRSLVNQPKVIVLDEPTSMLDIKSRINLLNCLSNVAKQGTTVVQVTHFTESILPETDRIIFIKSGRIIRDDKPSILLTSEEISNLFELNLKIQNSKGIWTVRPC